MPDEHAHIGRLVFLSDLQPTEVQETNYFDSPRPFRTDRSQGGRPLRLPTGSSASSPLPCHQGTALRARRWDQGSPADRPPCSRV